MVQKFRRSPVVVGSCPHVFVDDLQGFNTSKTVVGLGISEPSTVKAIRHSKKHEDQDLRRLLREAMKSAGWMVVVSPTFFLMEGKPKQNGWFSYFSKGKVYIFIYPRYAMYEFFLPLFPDICSISMVTQNWNCVFWFFLCVKGRVYFWKQRRPKSPKTFLLLYVNKLFPSRKGFFPPKFIICPGFCNEGLI